MLYLTHLTSQNEIKPIPARTKVFRIEVFFPYCIKEWSKLDDRIRNIKSINKLNATILNLILNSQLLVLRGTQFLIYMIQMELSC